jgi:hypothetical protein
MNLNRHAAPRLGSLTVRMEARRKVWRDVGDGLSKRHDSWGLDKHRPSHGRLVLVLKIGSVVDRLVGDLSGVSMPIASPGTRSMKAETSAASIVHDTIGWGGQFPYRCPLKPQKPAVSPSRTSGPRDIDKDYING